MGADDRSRSQPTPYTCHADALPASQSLHNVSISRYHRLEFRDFIDGQIPKHSIIHYIISVRDDVPKADNFPVIGELRGLKID